MIQAALLFSGLLIGAELRSPLHLGRRVAPWLQPHLELCQRTALAQCTEQGRTRRHPGVLRPSARAVRCRRVGCGSPQWRSGHRSCRGVDHRYHWPRNAWDSRFLPRCRRAAGDEGWPDPQGSRVWSIGSCVHSVDAVACILGAGIRGIKWVRYLLVHHCRGDCADGRDWWSGSQDPVCRPV